jgi:hypothetical protein
MRSIKPLFTLRRLQNILSLTLSIAAGIVVSGPMVSAHATTGDGPAPGQDDVSDWINGAFPCFTPRPTPCPGSCSQLAGLAQSFDNVGPPTLPPDWLATNVLGPPPLWVTSDSGLPMPPADTPPNAAFVDDPGVISDKRLDSLHFPVSGTGVQLLFEHNFNLEASDVDPNVGFDGGVLEISFDGGNTFQDILTVGGRFILGGYNRTISTDRGSPIAGRLAWSGDSGGVYLYRGQPCHSSPQAAGSAGEWPATTAAPVRAGASTQLLSLCAHRFRVVHRLRGFARLQRRAPCRPHRQALTVRPRLHRCLVQVRDSQARL